MLISQHILQEIEPYLTPQATVWVAFSGGVDSSVLLHALASIHDRKFMVKAIHVNHQLSNNAGSWEEHCTRFAGALGVEIEARRVVVELSGEGLEQAARKARYEVFSSIVNAGDILLCGHHADDQAETMLFRLVRGAGLRGLRGIPMVRSLANGTMVRPLLKVTRAELEHYAHQHGLSWIEDESNTDENLDRNYLRHKVLPLLQERWPGSNVRMQQTSVWLDESNSLLSEYARDDLAACGVRTEKLGQSICLKVYAEFGLARQKHVLREWVAVQGFSAPEPQHMLEVSKLIGSAEDSEAQVSWGACEVRRFRQRLYLIPRLPSIDSASSISWAAAKPLILPDGSVLELSSSSVETLVFSVKFRRGGERCCPKERSHSQTLKKLLQEYALEPWLRGRVPLIYAGSELVAVAGLFACKSGRAGPAASEIETSDTSMRTSLSPEELRFRWFYPEA